MTNNKFQSNLYANLTLLEKERLLKLNSYKPLSIYPNINTTFDLSYKPVIFGRTFTLKTKSLPNLSIITDCHHPQTGIGDFVKSLYQAILPEQSNAEQPVPNMTVTVYVLCIDDPVSYGYLVWYRKRMAGSVQSQYISIIPSLHFTDDTSDLNTPVKLRNYFVQNMRVQTDIFFVDSQMVFRKHAINMHYMDFLNRYPDHDGVLHVQFGLGTTGFRSLHTFNTFYYIRYPMIIGNQFIDRYKDRQILCPDYQYDGVLEIRRYAERLGLFAKINKRYGSATYTVRNPYETWIWQRDYKYSRWITHDTLIWFERKEKMHDVWGETDTRIDKYEQDEILQIVFDKRTEWDVCIEPWD